ncbi:hypothetical protein KEJ21_07265 [Candidatus Bathyarchaeota archaeon]|nr:hypothetical protein [Candidatus Bathyarchaeota archaeon]MBS7630578.1 hypothetical protein [Candidatus Bathyarchaeota archaeon]
MFQPVGSTCSTGLHESQSRLVENMIGRSSCPSSFQGLKRLFMMFHQL